MVLRISVQHREMIQNRLVQESMVYSQVLAENFSVFFMTIYRNSDYLQIQCIAKRESGSAVLSGQHFFTAGKSKEQNPTRFLIKELIGCYADQDLIDATTVTPEFAHALPNIPDNLTVNSPKILRISSLYRHTQLYALDEKLRKDIVFFGATMAYANVKQYYFVKAFIGIDIYTGLTSSNELNVRLAELIDQHAEKVYLLAVISKFGRKSFRHVLSFHQITGVIIDEEMPKSYLDIFREHKIRVMVTGRDT